MRARYIYRAVLIVLIFLAYRYFNHRSDSASPPGSPAPATSASAPAPHAEAGGGRNVPVPASCTPEVNRKLADLVAQQTSEAVDNVMVCGTTISPSRTQRGGRHGSHEILPLAVSLPGAGSKLVEVVINDELDGVVTAPKGAQVYAYGQAFFDQGSRFVAGIHDVHCATHRTADNGWVVVDGQKSPASCPAYR